MNPLDLVQFIPQNPKVDLVALNQIPSNFAENALQSRQFNQLLSITPNLAVSWKIAEKYLLGLWLTFVF